MHIEDPEGLERWNNAGKAPDQIQTVSAEIPSEGLAKALLEGTSGYFILDALSIKKSVLEKAGLMHEDLRLHQDTEWILRVAMTSRLFPGSLNEPVASWRVHAQTASQPHAAPWANWMTACVCGRHFTTGAGKMALYSSALRLCFG